MATFNNSLEEYLKLGRKASEKGDWPEAIKLSQKILIKFGNKASADAWLWLIKGYLNSMQLDKAEKIAAESLQNYPTKSKLVILAAKIAIAREDWRLAKKRWKVAIELLGEKSPNMAWSNLAKAQRMLHQLEKAETTAKTGFARDGQNMGILIELAEIHTSKEDWQTALTFWFKALKLIDKQSKPNIPTKQLVRFNISIIKRLVDIKTYQDKIDKYSKSKTTRKISIVTSMTKGYDTLKPPELLDDRFDYIVYTNDVVDDMGIFDVRPLPKPKLDDARAIRYVKTHPHTLLKEYEIVVWVDTSLMIVGDIYPLINSFKNSKKAIGSGVHPLRQNIYEEFQANVKLKKEDYQIMKRQITYYKSTGFEHDDLAENTLLMFNLKHKKLASALETWWDQIQHFSKRDQLSFNFALAKNDTEWFRLTKPPVDIRNHPGFVMTAHHTNHFVLSSLLKALKT